MNDTKAFAGWKHAHDSGAEICIPCLVAERDMLAKAVGEQNTLSSDEERVRLVRSAGWDKPPGLNRDEI